ncbi:MAG TPA: VacJ family lipoprotein [Gammaproteobacteria bacterium]|nr:VacJ family lipoprotein [Gammaproteobacteria bacterium]
MNCSFPLYKISQLATIFLLAVSLWGCATTASPEQAAAIAKKPMITDPFEPFNRTMYSFNKGLDTVLVKPIAEGYEAITPAPVRNSVGNFFTNIEEISVFVNKVLQARFTEAGTTAARFTVNSTVGVLGLFDMATRMGIEKTQADFGQTLYTWGIKRSAYLVLPVLGPTTVRDGIPGKAMDYYLSVWDFTPLEVQIAAFGLYAIHVRSTYLAQEDIIASAFDEYAFVRDIYIQRREVILKGSNDVTDWDQDLINEHLY